MDETQKVLSIQKRLHDLLGHEGWSVARDKLFEKISDLQNAFNIDDNSPENMLIDLKARKIATTILFDWFRELEGSASQFTTNDLTLNRESYIIRK